MPSPYSIERRKLQFVNTDPQNRCYNGAFFSPTYAWSSWEPFDYASTLAKANDRIKFWQSLNKIATDARGKSATAEYRICLSKP